jgi:hypothetical protein
MRYSKASVPLKGSPPSTPIVSVLPRGTLSPGSSIGQIIINADLVFNPGSTNIMEINADTGASDMLAGISNLTYGGTLLLTNVAGTLTNGSSFQLFSASNYTSAL